MKKVFFLSIFTMLLFISCNSSGDISLSGKDDYTFVTTITTSCSPNIQGYPQVTKSVTYQSGITEAQAKTVATTLTSTTTATTGGYTITQKMVTTYILTKNYKG